MRVVLIVTGLFVLVGKKLIAVVAFSGLCLIGIGFMLGSAWKPRIRKVRLNVKALLLAFRTWRITREIRATTRRLLAEHEKVKVASSGL